MPVARQHAAAARDEREYVTRTAQILRPGVRVDALAAGEAALLCGNAGRGVDTESVNDEHGTVNYSLEISNTAAAVTMVINGQKIKAVISVSPDKGTFGDI